MVGTHREGQAQWGREAEGGLRAEAGLGSSGVGAALGREVFCLWRGRGTVEDNQDWASGPPPRGTRDQRYQWGPRGSQAGVACSSVGTRSSPQQPWVLAGLTGKGSPKAHCRERRAGAPLGKGMAGAPRGRWGPQACQEMGCRAKGRGACLMAAVAGAAALQPQGVWPGGPGGAGEQGRAEGRRQLAPGKLWASSPLPGASPHEPGAGGTASSW